MYYNITYDICAVIVAALALAFFLTRRRSTYVHNTIFLAMAITSIVAPICDGLSSYALMHPENFSKVFIEITTYLYMLAHNILAYQYLLYVFTLSNMSIRHLKWGRYFSLFIPIMITLLIIFSNPRTHMLFTIGEDLSYNRGPAMIALYAISVYYVLYGAVHCLLAKQVTAGIVRVTLVGYCVIMLICCVVQYLYPSQVVESFGISCSLLLMLFALQKPEDYVDASVGLFDHNAFDRTYELRAKAKAQYRVFLITVEDVRMVKQTVGVTTAYHIFRQMGDFCRSLVGDKVFLMAEDSFALILDNMDKSDEAVLRKKINARFQEDWVYEDRSMMASIRTLIISVPDDADEVEVIYSYMDYMRDLDSSHKWEMTARDINLEDGKRQRLVARALRDAVENDRFEVYYQPIYSNLQERIRSAEALLRLNDPNIGPISPAEFIHIAEQNGMIHRIGEIVLEKVCEFLATSDVLENGVDYVEVNLSAIQCMRDDLCERLLNIINLHGIGTDRINLEITETATANSPRLLYYNMKQLSDCGITFSLDDFGTGYSNMNSLTGLPLEIIKFDKSLIDMATESDRGKMVLMSSVAMVKRMGLLIVAEGVETKEQLDFIMDMGIDYVQGYYFSKPLQKDQFADYVRRFNM